MDVIYIAIVERLWLVSGSWLGGFCREEAGLTRNRLSVRQRAVRTPNSKREPRNSATDLDFSPLFTSHIISSSVHQKNMRFTMATCSCKRPGQSTHTPHAHIRYATTILLLLAAVSATTLVQGRTSSLSPLSIGIRSAIARGPLGYGSTKSNLSSSQRRDTPSLRIDRVADTPLDVEDDLYAQEEETEECLTHRVNRGGASAVAAIPDRRLHFWEAMICGAFSRSAAQTIMHPANTMKTILQSSRSIPGQAPLTVKSFTQWQYAKQLTRGAGAQLILSIPHGAVNFAVLEFVRRQMNNIVSQSRYADVINRNFGAGMDFLSSALSTICCSVVSTPQMMICDNIMAGTYPNLFSATTNLMKDKGVAGFYTGWWPGIAGKIPSYVSFTHGFQDLFCKHSPFSLFSHLFILKNEGSYMDLI